MLLMLEERRGQQTTNMVIDILNAFWGPRNGYAPRSKLLEFQRTNPPKISQTIDPLEADDWLRTIEKKLEISCCHGGDKVPFAAYYLEGSTHVWWDNLKEMLNGGENPTWSEFKDLFKKAHIPKGVIKRKLKEFLSLTQGTMTVVEYLNKFNKLVKYANHAISN